MINLHRKIGFSDRKVFVLIASVVLSGSALAQSAGGGLDDAVELSEFEVATIKPHQASDPAVYTDSGPPGRFEARNITAKALVELAFNVPPDRVFGGPPWVGSQHFDVTGKISDTQWQDLNKLDDDLRNQSIQHMLQFLLNQRFHLAISHEQKDLLVFALVVAKSGAKFSVSGTPKRPELFNRSEVVVTFDQNDIPVSALANFLAGHFGHTVLDCTGLSGRYDIRLRIEIPDENSSDAVDKAIFRALEDQLGLKLVTRREVLDTIMIDQMEQPSNN